MSHVSTPVVNHGAAPRRFSNWSEAEDKALLSVCDRVRNDAKHHNWEEVSRLMKDVHTITRSAKECRKEYQNVRTDPVQKRTTPQGKTWSPAECALLKELCERHRSATSNHTPWKAIARELNRRGIQKTDKEARHRWERMKRGAVKRAGGARKGAHTCKKCGQPRAGHICLGARAEAPEVDATPSEAYAAAHNGAPAAAAPAANA